MWLGMDGFFPFKFFLKCCVQWVGDHVALYIPVKNCHNFLEIQWNNSCCLLNGV